MDLTLLIGIAVVALGTGVGAIMMFGQRSNSLAETGVTSGTIPATSSFTPRDLTVASARRETPEHLRPPVPRGLRSTQVRIRWYHRVRAVFGLLLITIGIGMAAGAVVGAAALVLSALIG